MRFFSGDGDNFFLLHRIEEACEEGQGVSVGRGGEERNPPVGSVEDFLLILGSSVVSPVVSRPLAAVTQVYRLTVENQSETTKAGENLIVSLWRIRVRQRELDGT